MTAWRRAAAGEIPGAFLSEAGRWLIEISDNTKTSVVAYARVSSHDQKADLDRQVARLAEWAAAQGITINRFVREIGSGLNDKRRELNQLLADPVVTTLVVEHRDRLARFGVSQLQEALKSSGRQIVVVDPGEVQDDLAQDMIDLMTCFSAKLYGRRSARNRAHRAIESLAS